MLRTAIAATALIATGALAQVRTTVADRPEGPVSNPDQIVCVRELITGSRIAQQRVCRTRAEWAEYHAQARLVTERVQMFKTTCGDSGICRPDPRLPSGN